MLSVDKVWIMTDFAKASAGLRKKVRAQKRAEERLKYGPIKRSRTKGKSKTSVKSTPESVEGS
jgi:hypothetical protein